MYRNLFIDSGKEIIKTNNFKYQTKSNKLINSSKFRIDLNNKKYFKYEMGDYYIINYDYKVLYKNPVMISKKIHKVINNLIKKYKIDGSILIIGLGNSSVIGDSLGPKTISKLIATNHYDNFISIPKVALFAPEVISKTGISSFNIINMLVKDLKPSLIIFIDSLETSNKDNLDYTIEITDGGIIPGSSINTNKEINKNTFNIPIIAIGVPLFLNINKNLYNSLNIDDIVSKTSDVLAKSLNYYLFH